jgi:hypothetical protein
MIISFRQPTVSGSVHSQVDYFSIMQQPVVCGFYTSVGKLTCLLAYFDLSKQCLDFLAMNDLRKSLLQCSSDLLTVVYRLSQFTWYSFFKNSLFTHILFDYHGQWRHDLDLGGNSAAVFPPYWLQIFEWYNIMMSVLADHPNHVFIDHDYTIL